MISFALDDDQQLVQETVRKFAVETLRPNARAWERAGEVPEVARRAFHELSLSLADVPEAAGGGGLGMLTACLAHEELGWGDAGAAVALWAPHHAAAVVTELADEQQAARLLAPFAAGDGAERLGAVAWSERRMPAEGFTAVAESVEGGYRLRGDKAFVTNAGRAALTIVFAQVEPERGWQGIGAFAIEGSAEGMEAGERAGLLGLETAFAADLKLGGVFVPEENRLRGGTDFLGAVWRFWARVSLVNAARQVGLARAAYEYALAYTQERHAFGKPVAHFQAVAFTLAELAMDVDAARWLLWRAAAAFDRPETADAEWARLVAEAAVHCNEAAFRAADGCVQLLGGAGYLQDHPAEKWLRDTKALASCAPSDQLCQLVAASALLGQEPIDAALPAGIQPVFT